VHLEQTGSVMMMAPLSACGRNQIYVEVVFWQLYIYWRPVVLFMWLI